MRELEEITTELAMYLPAQILENLSATPQTNSIFFLASDLPSAKAISQYTAVIIQVAIFVEEPFRVESIWIGINTLIVRHCPATAIAVNATGTVRQCKESTYHTLPKTIVPEMDRNTENETSKRFLR